MIRALYTASTGMHAQQLNIDTMAHNMSNVNTNGYKKQRVEFQDLLYQNIKRPSVSEDRNEPVGLSIGLGVKPSAVNTLFDQGNFQPTGNPLDVAINGNAFFKIEVQGQDDPLYSKSGAFKVDGEGNLVSSDGYYVMGVDSLEEGAYDIAIEKDGRVSYKLPGDDDIQEAGYIELAKFVNSAGLQKLGSNLYQATENSGEAIDWDPEDDSTISLQSGYLEASNVDVVEEMVSLISAQRAYDFSSKVIQSADEMLQAASNLRR